LFGVRGWSVFAGDIDEPRGRELERDEAALGHPLTFVPADVRDRDSLARLIEKAAGSTGRLDALVNNAGVEKYGQPAELTGEDWERIVNVNLRATFWGSQIAHPHLAGCGGSIVNISSVQAYANEPGVSIYAATKAGILGLTRSLALDFAGSGVRVNAVCPGAILTGMTEAYFHTPEEREEALGKIAKGVPLGRIGQPGDVAKTVYFLASSEAEYVTGASLVVDGGLLARLAL
jgi:NAD(P)-dependent dehydrogenase (short-subunit alcohol dehydrogenase family)